MWKSRIVWALVWVNIALLIGWAMRLTSPKAEAQLRRPSDYLMIPGEVIGGNSAAIYILDTTQSQLSAVSFDDSTGQLATMKPAIDLNQVFQAAMGGGGR
jgi:Na+/glutamate symporter